jgi:hypothetical protein
MEQTSSRNIVLVGLGILVILGLKWVGTHWSTRNEGFHTTDGSYEMARAKSPGSEFDLSGRDIDRQVLTDEEKQILEAKKKNEVANAVKPQVANAVANKNSGKTAGKKFQTNFVDTSREMGLSQTVNQGSNPQTLFADSNQLAEAPMPQARPVEQNPGKKGKSAAEWMALMSSHATAQQIADFLAAHQSGEIADADFYKITFALYNSQNTQTHQAGVDILTADTSINSFVYIANEYTKQGGSAQTSSGLWPILQSYSQAAKFAALNQALRSSDQNIVMISLQILALAVQDVQQQQVATASSQGNPSVQAQRGLAGNNSQVFNMFSNNLKNLAQAGSSNSGTAQSLLSQIQTIVRG